MYDMFLPSQEGCRADGPAAGVRGPHRPLLRFPKQHAERRMEKQTSASQNGSRGNAPGVNEIVDK